MEKESEIDSLTINCLPDEIIIMILKHNNYREMLHFGSTCKRFYDLVKECQLLWKNEYKRTLPLEMFKVIVTNGNGNWLKEVKDFLSVKKRVYSELTGMSSLFYWQASEITFQDVRIFLTVALSRNQNYYYLIYILQDLIKKTNKTVEKNRCIKPFTLTEMHYAKVVLRHIVHVFLAMKWVIAHVREELPPEMVVNFFLQWVDTANMHSDETLECKLQEMVKHVEEILISKSTLRRSSYESLKEKCAKGLITKEEILHAITHVLYRQRHMTVTTTANLDTLNIIKTLENRCGNVIVVAAIYHAIARRCGVKCELVVFPNHLFLEFRHDWKDPNALAYTVDLKNGDLNPKRRCPFSQNPHNNRYKYYPESLLQSIYSGFHMSMGYIKDWNTQNALHLLDFLGTSHTDFNPYRSFFAYLIEHVDETALSTPLDLKYMDSVHHQLLISISNMNSNTVRCEKDIVVKRHDTRIRYAVGMICYHKKMNYICVIRGWDPRCRPEWVDRMELELKLNFGMGQPFYYVVAVDQSTRYVAQENIKDVKRPTRLYHLEDIIAREFTHYDGFCYVPNDEKRYEYPDEDPIASMYRSRAAIKD